MGNLKISSIIEDKSLQVFCDEVWRKKPWSHNRIMAFYHHLKNQPTLKKNEPPVVRLTRGEKTEALLCFMKHLYRSHSVYSGINFYVLPEMEYKGSHGMRLLFYWAKNCDVMLAAAPRKNTVQFYEKARWSNVFSYRYKYHIKFISIYETLKETRSVFSAAKSCLIYLKDKLSSNNIGNYEIENISKFNPEIDDFIISLKDAYKFIHRDSKLLNWRYFTFNRKGTFCEAYIIRSKLNNKIVGYFVIADRGKNIKIPEIFSKSANWNDVVKCLKKVLAKHKKRFAIVETNNDAIINILKKNNFIFQRSIYNFFKTKPKCDNLIKDFTSNKFLISLSDSDEYMT